MFLDLRSGLLAANVSVSRADTYSPARKHSKSVRLKYLHARHIKKHLKMVTHRAIPSRLIFRAIQHMNRRLIENSAWETGG